MKCRICDSEMTTKSRIAIEGILIEEYITCDICHGSSYEFSTGNVREVLAYPTGDNHIEAIGHYLDPKEVSNAREEAIVKFATYLRAIRINKNEDQ